MPMKTCPVTAENIKDKLLLEKWLFWAFNLHFAGEGDKSKNANFKFLQDLSYQKLFKSVYFCYLQNNRVAFLKTRGINHVLQ